MEAAPRRCVAIAPGTSSKKSPGIMPAMLRSITLVRGDCAASTTPEWKSIVSCEKARGSPSSFMARTSGRSRAANEAPWRCVALRPANP